MYDVGGTPTPYTVVRTTDSNGWTGYFYTQAEGNMYVTGDGTKTITVP